MALVAVHVGAGYHASHKEEGYKRAMCDAIAAALAALRGGSGSDGGGSGGSNTEDNDSTALAAVVAALRALEDCPLTNAGRGSNLTLAGTVECDAAVMEGSGGFGALGAAPGVRHPAAAAARLLRDARRPLPLGLVRPMFLAGDAARRWARARGLEAAADAAEARSWLVTPAAREAWEHYSRLLADAGGHELAPPGACAGVAGPAAAADHRGQVSSGQALPQTNGFGAPAAAAAAAAAAPAAAAATAAEARHGDGDGAEPLNKRARVERGESEQQHQQHQSQRLAETADTVGAVVVDARGRVAAGVSSGGLVLKFEGRIGEAAVHGCGCWAADPGDSAGDGGDGGDDDGSEEQEDEEPGLAVSISGLGEAIMAAALARATDAALRRRQHRQNHHHHQQQPQSANGMPDDDDNGDGDAAVAQLAALLRATMAPPGRPAVECGVLAARVTRTGQRRRRRQQGQQDHQQQGQQGQQQQQRRRVRVELAACATSQTFGVGYQAAGMARPEALILRRGNGSGGGSGASAGVAAAAAATSHPHPLIEFEFCCIWDAPSTAAALTAV